MEQTFVQQCNEDSRIVMKFMFVVRNISLLSRSNEQADQADSVGHDSEHEESCIAEQRPKTIRCLCDHCGCAFYAKLHTKPTKYCSLTCKDAAHRARCKIEQVCFFCKKTFRAVKYHITHAKNKEKICCSKSCANKARSKKARMLEFSCAWCGKQVIRKVSKIRSPRCFCSSSCAAKAENFSRKEAKAAAELTAKRRPKDCP